MSYALGILSWSHSVWLPFLEGSGLPSSLPSPPLVKMWFCSRCLHQWAIMDKMLWAAAVVAVFLLLLSILHCHGKAHHEFLSYAFNAIGVFTLSTFFFIGTLFFQMCHPYSRGPSRLSALQLLKREKPHHLRLSCSVSSLALGWFHWLFFLSLPHCLEIIRISLFIGAGLQVGYHCFEPFRQPTIEVVTLQLSYMVWRKAFQEWCHENLKVSWQTHTLVRYCLFFTHS